jgi:hypothetical protein
VNARRRHAPQRALGLGAGALRSLWASRVHAQHQERRGGARPSPQHFGHLFPSLPAIADGTTPVSLPQRNLLRQLTWQMRSGQSIAQALRVPALRAGDLSKLAGYCVNLERSTPLWYCVLKEAQLASGGQTLGPVGRRIVAEVLIGLLQSDRAAWLHGQPQWRPTLPSRRGADEFDMVDLLSLAGVDPKSRGQ